ncbi:ribonuclease H1-like [Rhynchophorus ferrugineus]|uniref:ribonuclease H n=1 Tax=Rhynchophorus ferrugineus TaxID=354439 RepID=A0A834HLT1_RHYFE|nr:hypothetical protein GWI33_000800 [Rhynchophorus ferrugineus]KAF7263995.1 hypothetical protein GWI33_000783 [Rhynchophorus ferrugineus]
MHSETNLYLPLEDGYVVAYADGACVKNGLSEAKSAYGVWFSDKCPLNIGMPLDGPATNMRAEVQASTAALQLIHKLGYDKAKIYTDSSYILSCVNGWIDKWKANDWCKGNRKPVKNYDVLLKFDGACSIFSDIKWEHVCGHSGHYGNEAAHKLAQQAAKLQQITH